MERVLLAEDTPLFTGGFYFAFGIWVAIAIGLVATVLYLQMRENSRKRGH